MTTTPTLRVHGFETSNNIKVRIALGYKKLPFSFHTIDPSDRAAIVKLSGQHLTPVLEHGATVLFDSAAILRYLDANFPETPKLFGGSREAQWAIEDHEFYARTALAGPMLEVVHARIRGQPLGPADSARAEESYGNACATVAARLKDREWLVGDSMTAADITTAAVLFRVRSGELFPMNPAMLTLWPWVERVMQYDPGA